jgi:hypothetical protein
VFSRVSGEGDLIVRVGIVLKIVNEFMSKRENKSRFSVCDFSRLFEAPEQKAKRYVSLPPRGG